MDMTDEKTDLVVIGGGPAGYAAAFLAADLAMEVVLIDPEANPGGTCLHHGCIPSKALLHVAKLMHEARAAEAWGITFAEPHVDLDKLRRWKTEVVDNLTGGLGRLVAKRKVRHIRGTAAFSDNHTLAVTSNDGRQNRLAFQRAIIATGSKPMALPALPVDHHRIWNSKSALALASIPQRLLVVGGGYIGLELGTVYAALGSRVSVAEMTPALLPGVDRDLVRFLHKGLEERFEQILLQTRVSQVDIDKKGVKVTLKPSDDQSTTQQFDGVLVAVGRRPNSDGLALEKTRIRTDERGFIAVDARRRTAEPHILAVGDIAGEPMLAHKASHEARVAVEVLNGKNVAYEPSAIPGVVFTDPEIAWAGLTESDARQRKIPHKTARFPWAASGRAATLGRSDGLTKLVIDPQNERLLGAGMVGPGAGEMIAEAVLAIEMAATATDLALTMHPHPTLSETVMEAAEVYHGLATHYYRPRKKPPPPAS
jgi:dihydrolipoamide dehydrogenase